MHGPSGTTPTFLPSGGGDQTIDFGFYKPATISGFVYLDFNTNGVKDSGDSPISGVTVKLLDSNGKKARFHETNGLSAWGDKLYIADTNNHAIRVCDLKTGTVSTLQVEMK